MATSFPIFKPKPHVRNLKNDSGGPGEPLPHFKVTLSGESPSPATKRRSTLRFVSLIGLPRAGGLEP